MWIPGNLDKSSFGGVMGKGAQVENVRGRIIGGEEIIVTVDNYLFACLAVQRSREMGQYLEGDVWSMAGFLKWRVILEHAHLQTRMQVKIRQGEKWKEQSP